MNALTIIPFHRHSIATMRQGGKIWVAIRPICESLGLDRKAQQNRIKRDPVLSTCGVIMTLQMPGDDQAREVFFLDLDYLNGWLFGISANAVKPHLRETIIEYQHECYAVLARHFRREVASEHVELSNRLFKAERAYFARYPKDKEIRREALQGNPYWYIAQRVKCCTGTVGKAIKRMLEYGFIEVQSLTNARTGMTRYWRWLRNHRQQIPLF